MKRILFFASLLFVMPCVSMADFTTVHKTIAQCTKNSNLTVKDPDKPTSEEKTKIIKFLAECLYSQGLRIDDFSPDTKYPLYAYGLSRVTAYKLPAHATGLDFILNKQFKNPAGADNYYFMLFVTDNKSIEIGTQIMRDHKQPLSNTNFDKCTYSNSTTTETTRKTPAKANDKFFPKMLTLYHYTNGNFGSSTDYEYIQGITLKTDYINSFANTMIQQQLDEYLQQTNCPAAIYLVVADKGYPINERKTTGPGGTFTKGNHETYPEYVTVLARLH